MSTNTPSIGLVVVSFKDFKRIIVQYEFLHFHYPAAWKTMGVFTESRVKA